MRALRLMAGLTLLVVACGDDDGSPTDAGVDSAIDTGTDAGPIDTGVDTGPPPSDLPFRGPWVLQVETDRAAVRWETWRLAPALVGVEFTPEAGGETQTVNGTTTTDEITFGFDNAFTELPDVPGTYHLHEVVLDGLTPATCYVYSIVGSPDDGGRFCTMHEATDHTTAIDALVIGDTNPFLGTTGPVLDNALMSPVEFVVHMGDVQYYASVGETWNLWFREMAPMIEAGAFFPTIGNHEDERDGEFEATYARFFESPSRDGNTSRYHFQTGGVHFFSVNSEDDIGEYDATFTWLDDALTAAEATDGFRFSVVYFHRPAYTLADHAPSMRIRDALEPVVQSHVVPLVMQGHNHVYERFEVGEITYIVSGGGGSGTYELDTHVEDRPEEAAMRVAAGRWHHAIRLHITDGNIHGDVIDDEGMVQDQFDLTVP